MIRILELKNNIYFQILNSICVVSSASHKNNYQEQIKTKTLLKYSKTIQTVHPSSNFQFIESNNYFNDSMMRTYLFTTGEVIIQHSNTYSELVLRLGVLNAGVNKEYTNRIFDPCRLLLGNKQEDILPIFIKPKHLQHSKRKKCVY